MKILKLLTVVFSAFLTSCNVGSGVTPTFFYKLPELNKNVSIKEQTVFEGNGLKIVAKKIFFSGYSLLLYFDFYNNSDLNYNIISGNAYTNEVSANGWLLEDGYLNVDCSSGCSANDYISISYSSFKILGIETIGYFELGFEIRNIDGYGRFDTGTIKIETSAYNNYDKNVKYRNNVKYGGFDEEYNTKSYKFIEKTLYNHAGSMIQSFYCFKNKDDYVCPMIELWNSSNLERNIYFNNLSINGLLVDEYFDYICLRPFTNGLPGGGSFNYYIKNYEGNKNDINPVNKISFEVGYEDSSYTLKDIETIEIDLPKINVVIEE